MPELAEFNIFDFIFKMMPNIMAIIRSLGGFSFSQVKRGIEINRDLCVNYGGAENSGFSCVKGGVTALMLMLTGFSSSTSVIIISHFSNKLIINQGGIILGIVYMALIFFIFMGKPEIYSSHVMLAQSQNWIYKKIGNHLLLYWNVFNAVLVAAYQFYA